VCERGKAFADQPAGQVSSPFRTPPRLNRLAGTKPRAFRDQETNPAIETASADLLHIRVWQRFGPKFSTSLIPPEPPQS
jgi:hypothetical protein